MSIFSEQNDSVLICTMLHGTDASKIGDNNIVMVQFYITQEYDCNSQMVLHSLLDN